MGDSFSGTKFQTLPFYFTWVCKTCTLILGTSQMATWLCSLASAAVVSIGLRQRCCGTVFTLFFFAFCPSTHPGLSSSPTLLYKRYFLQIQLIAILQAVQMVIQASPSDEMKVPHSPETIHLRVRSMVEKLKTTAYAWLLAKYCAPNFGACVTCSAFASPILERYFGCMQIRS